MANESVKLRARAGVLGIKGFRAMDLDELRVAVEEAEYAKLEAAAGPNKGEPKRKAAKRKTKKKVSTKAPKVTKAEAEETSEAPAEKSAKTGKAKRPAEKKVAAPKKRGRPKGSKNVPKAEELVAAVADEKPAKKKAKVAKSKVKKVKTTKVKDGASGRNLIDLKGISWDVEWSGANRGKRKMIFDALKKFKGDREKAFEHLVPLLMEPEMYGKRNPKTGKKWTKANATINLRWALSRLTFDYAIETGQHEKATNRVAWGTRKPAKPKAAAEEAQTSTEAEEVVTEAKKAPKKRGRPAGKKPNVTPKVKKRTGKSAKVAGSKP